MKRIENMQKDRYLLEEERRKNEDEMNEKKNIMLKRLEQVIKSDKNMTKDEIMDYVINNVEPGNNKDNNNASGEEKK